MCIEKRFLFQVFFIAEILAEEKKRIKHLFLKWPPVDQPASSVLACLPPRGESRTIGSPHVRGAVSFTCETLITGTFPVNTYR
jgi:hypothetical protein